MKKTLKVVSSGDWQHDPLMDDYRAEWLSDMLVERATVVEGAPEQQLESVTIGAPGYIWFRFWLAEGEHILEKYFDDQGEELGMYARIGMAVPHRGRGFSSLDLLLGLWITVDAHVTVHNEAAFDDAVNEGLISPVEAEHAEHQIREITMAIANKRFPPALIRNLSLLER